MIFSGYLNTDIMSYIGRTLLGAMVRPAESSSNIPWTTAEVFLFCPRAVLSAPQYPSLHHTLPYPLIDPLYRPVTTSPHHGLFYRQADGQLASPYPPSPIFSSFGAASVVLFCFLPDSSKTTLPMLHICLSRAVFFILWSCAVFSYF